MLRLVTEMFVFISKCCKVDISNCQNWRLLFMEHRTL